MKEPIRKLHFSRHNFFILIGADIDDIKVAISP